jgi:hypothetical protein
MAGFPLSRRDDNNRQNERYSDNGEPSKAAFPILIIPHAALHVNVSNPDIKLSW